MSEAFLSVDALEKSYAVGRGLFARRQTLRALAGVSFDVARGSTFGLVGESGAGKSTLARLLLAAEAPSAGRIEIDGRELGTSDAAVRREQRRKIQPVLQDPYGALNPRMRIGDIVAEPLVIHRAAHDKTRYRARVAMLLEQVGLPADAARRFPHELSGGQRQRVAIARALSLTPECIVLDEPVSALDVSIQAQILNLLKALQRSLGLTYVLISHDLAVVAYMSDTIGVLYLGRFMETGSAAAILARALHPYTRALMAGTDTPARGEAPSPLNPPRGCPFHPRCAWAQARCGEETPPLRDAGDGVFHRVACHFTEQIATENI